MAHRNVLLITAGLPALVTETIWALAHPSLSGARRRFEVGEVLVCTTSSARGSMEAVLCDRGGPLDALCKEIGIPPLAHSKRIAIEGLVDASGPLTREQAIEFGDGITQHVLRYTLDPDVVLHLSNCGGLNPMRPLAQTAMNLFGRLGDEISYTNVSREFERCADFFWPSAHYPPACRDPKTGESLAAGEVVLANGQRRRASEARIELVSYPFVRQRTRVSPALSNRQKVYSAWLRENELLQDIDQPTLVLDLARRTARFGDLDPLVFKDTRAFALYWVLAVWARLRLKGPREGRLRPTALELGKAAGEQATFGWKTTPRDLYGFVYQAATRDMIDGPARQELAAALRDPRQAAELQPPKKMADIRSRLEDEIEGWIITPELAVRLGVSPESKAKSIGIDLRPEQIELVPPIHEVA
jgi:CRISPR-associated protein (TIGR02584 family)